MTRDQIALVGRLIQSKMHLGCILRVECIAAHSANIKKDIFDDSDFDLISTPSERNATSTKTSGFGFWDGRGWG